jgi:hypothetical protein
LDVFTIAYSTAPPVLTTVLIGIDTQPIFIPFLTTHSPDYSKPATFTLSPSTDPFTSLTSLTVSGGDVRISGATIAQHGTYNYVLTACADAGSKVANFSVFIKNPCSSAVFQPKIPSPLSEMSIIMYYLTTETKSQTVKILSDVEVAHPTIICPITAVLTPTLNYIKLSVDYT